jgi:hypothetical protein
VLQQLRTAFSNGFGLPPFRTPSEAEADEEAAAAAAQAAAAAARAAAADEAAAKQEVLKKYMPFQVGSVFWVLRF